MMRLTLVFLFVLFSTVAGFADQLVINVGTTANDGLGDPVRTAFQKANTNFTAVFLNILTVSNTVTANTANLTTVSNSLTTVSNSLTGKINAQTGTTYTFLSADAGKLTTFTNASAVAVTLAVFADGTVFHAKNLGAGVVTITPTGALIDFAATLILTKGQSASIFSDGSNYRTTLTMPLINSEQVANTVKIQNPQALTNDQTLEVYLTSDHASNPTNFARMQIRQNSLDMDNAGTTGAGTFFTLGRNGAAKFTFDMGGTAASVHTGPDGLFGFGITSPPTQYSFDTTIKRKTTGVISASTGTVNDTGQFSSINGLSIGSIFTQTADVAVANTTTETSILGTGSGSKTITAAALNTVGRTLRVRVGGMVGNFSGSPTLTIRAKIGGTTILTGAVAMVNATANHFEAEFLLTVRSTGSGGSFACNGNFNHGMTTGDIGHASLVVAGTQITDLTLSRVVDVTAQWGTANASNTITSQIATIEILN